MSRIDPASLQIQNQLRELNREFEEHAVNMDPLSAEDQRRSLELIRQISAANWAHETLLKTRHDLFQAVMGEIR